MKVHITFQQNNPNFNQIYADEYHGGEDSPSNWKYQWLSVVKASGPVKNIHIRKDAVYELTQSTAGVPDSHFSIPHMTICECVMENDKVMEFAVSDSLLERMVHPKNYAFKTAHVYFYFKPDIEFIHPREGVYIAQADMPQAWKTAPGQAALKEEVPAGSIQGNDI